MSRIRWIDVARGIGIVLVVAGHSFAADGLANRVIDAFHMPLFFVISGYIFGLTAREDSPVTRTLSSGVRRLLLPYLGTGVIAYLYWLFVLRFQTGDANSPLHILGLLSTTFAYGASEVVRQFPLIGPVGPMWFLPALFCAQAVFWLLLRLRNRRWALWAATAVVSGVGMYLGSRFYMPWSLDIALGVQVFLLAGWEAARRRVFEASLTLWQGLLLAAVLATDVYAGGLSLHDRQWGIVPLSIAGALAGCWLVFELSKRLVAVGWAKRAFTYLGTVSLVILCYHTMDTGFFHWDWIKPISGLFVPGWPLFVMRMAVSVAIAWFVTTLPGLRWVYGHRRRRVRRAAAEVVGASVTEAEYRADPCRPPTLAVAAGRGSAASDDPVMYDDRRRTDRGSAASAPGAPRLSGVDVRSDENAACLDARRPSATAGRDAGRRGGSAAVAEVDGAQGTSSPKNRRIGLVALVVLVGTALSVCIHYIYGVYLGMSYPMTSFLFIPGDRFRDLLNTISDVRLFDAVRGGVTLAYTPLQHLFLYVGIRTTSLLGIEPTLLWIIMAAFLALLVYFLGRFFIVSGLGGAANATRVFILTALCYPVLLVLDRANTEMLVFAAVFGFVFFYYIKPRRWLWIACLAIAICLKMYPAVLVLIPLSDRRFRDSSYALLGAVAATLVAVWVLGLQTQYGFAGVLHLWATYLFEGQGGSLAIWWPGIQHGHSLWGAFYLSDVLAGQPFSMASLRTAYLGFAAVAAAAGAAWMFLGRLRPWQKLTLATFMYLLLPFSSHDYTLLHVFFPLALFVATGKGMRFDRTLTVLFGLLLVPLDYYYFTQNPRLWPLELTQSSGPLMAVSVLLYPLVMLAILALVAVQTRRRRPAVDVPQEVHRRASAGHGSGAHRRARSGRHASPAGTVDSA